MKARESRVAVVTTVGNRLIRLVKYGETTAKCSEFDHCSEPAAAACSPLVKHINVPKLHFPSHASYVVKF